MKRLFLALAAVMAIAPLAMANGIYHCGAPVNAQGMPLMGGPAYNLKVTNNAVYFQTVNTDIPHPTHSSWMRMNFVSAAGEMSRWQKGSIEAVFIAPPHPSVTLTISNQEGPLTANCSQAR